MRLISYRTSSAEETGRRLGAVIDGGVVDCTDASPDGLAALLRAGGSDRLRRIVDTREPSARLDEVELLPPVPEPAKILCVGLNYRVHLRETGHPEPAFPTLFSRYADTQIGHLAPALIPPDSDHLDYEGELAVIIGEPAYRVAEADAWRVVGGYSVYNDFSVRDWQRHTSQFLPGKNFPATGGFGPWLVTADQIDDIAGSVLTTRVNGEVRQQAPISDLVFDIPRLIAYITTFTALAPGDVVVTGTPGGVGLFRDPPAFLRPGDEVRVEITGIGELTNPIAATHPIVNQENRP